MKATFQGFKEFVSSQDADRWVHHHMWDTCAMGDYAESLGHPRSDAMGIACHILPEPLYDALNQSSDGPKGNTYGELSEFLKSF